jgi:plastocyanin
MTMRFPLRAALCAAVCLLAAPALAGDLMIVQKDKNFSRGEIKIRSGDRVVFRNDDSVVHNIYSLSPGFAFEIKTQLPGQLADQRFQGKGEAEVRCAIHPQMKLKVVVEE